MSFTPRFDLPLLNAGQAQKEITHNEALTIIDALIHPCALTFGSNSPPADAVAGQSWIVGQAPDGAWTDAADTLAVWTGGGWRFALPCEGMRVRVEAAGVDAVYSQGAWRLGHVEASEFTVNGNRVVGQRQAAIEAPTGGDVRDVEVRETVTAILNALQAHGLIGA